MFNAAEVRQNITNQIVTALQNGNLPPWRKPWRDDSNSGLHTSLSTGARYKGINQLLLELSAMQRNFQSKWWGTFNQIKAKGAHVAKGQKGTQIILYKPVKRSMTDASGDETDTGYCMMRSFTVFNAEQTSGLEQYRVGFSPPASPIERFEAAGRVIDATGAEIRYGGSRAFYSRTDDFIQCPHRHQFELPEWYETLFHELVHWSESRLEWTGSYAMGELVAEMGACFMASELGLPNSNDMTNHFAYLQSWLKAMQDDPKFIFQASTQASKAVDLLLSFSRTTETADDPEAVPVEADC